jgi:hypothetical protein
MRAFKTFAEGMEAGLVRTITELVANENGPRMTQPKHVIRRGSLAKDEYLQHDGSFGAHKTAKRFDSAHAADTHAEKHLGHLNGNYGVFPVSTARRMQG